MKKFFVSPMNLGRVRLSLTQVFFYLASSQFYKYQNITRELINLSVKMRLNSHPSILNSICLLKKACIEMVLSNTNTMLDN